MTPSVHEVRKRLRSASTVRLSWRTRLAVWYERLVYGGIFGGLVVGLFDGGVQQVVTREVTDWQVACLVVLAGVVFLKALLAFGPLFARPDQMFWVLGSPLDRTSSLRRKLVVLLVLGALGVVAGGPPLPSAALGVTIAAGAVVLQGTRVRTHVVQLWLSALAAVAALTLLVPNDVRLEPLPLWVTPGAVVMIPLAHWTLRRLTRARLSAGAALASAAAVSVGWFDLALLGSILVERRAKLVGRVRSARLRGSPFTVLVWADLLRVVRARNALLVWAALLPVPALVGGVWAPAIHTIAAFLAVDRLAGGLRFVCRSPAIRRAMGLPERFLRLAHLVVPLAGAVIWSAVTVPLTPGLSVVNAVVSALSAVVVVYRIATRPPLDYNFASVDFGVLGPTPVGLIVQLSRGPALLVAVAWVQVAIL